MVLNSASRLEMRASIVVIAAMLRYHAIVLMFLRSKRLPDHNQVRDPCWGSRCADSESNFYLRWLPRKLIFAEFVSRGDLSGPPFFMTYQSLMDVLHMGLPSLHEVRRILRFN